MYDPGHLLFWAGPLREGPKEALRPKKASETAHNKRNSTGLFAGLEQRAEEIDYVIEETTLR